MKNHRLFHSFKTQYLTLIISILSVGALSSCSQYNKKDAPTIANPQTTPMIVDKDFDDNFDNNFDNQSSRNNGAWGAVYMSKEALTRPPMNIVDVDSIPQMSNDASLQKSLAKFEGSTQGKTGFFTTNGKKLL